MLTSLNTTLSQDAQNLTRALKGDRKAVGNWGEVILQDVLERAGLVIGQHFELQLSGKTDDGQTQELNFVVDIREALSIAPALVFWKVGQPAQPRTVQLDAAPGATVRVKSVTSSNPRFAATLQTVKAGEQYVVSVKPADTAQKETAQLTVQTDYPPDSPRADTIHARIK